VARDPVENRSRSDLYESATARSFLLYAIFACMHLRDGARPLRHTTNSIPRAEMGAADAAPHHSFGSLGWG
jgi:hypothetical protein